jgi:kumamolisin
MGDLLAEFPANVKIYHHARGTYRGRQGEIRIPKELEGIVTGVYGYDTRPKYRSRRRLIRNSGPGGSNGVAATHFAKRYNFPTSFNGTTLDGSGQTIAIIELGGGFRNNDLKAFFQEIGVALPDVVSVSVNHGENHPTGDPDSADGEVVMDIEVAGAVAPQARIAVYFARNTNKGFLDAISAAIHDSARQPSVISISWGSAEPDDKTETDPYHHLFVQAAALGVTVCVASGDHGTADLDAFEWDGKIHVDHPSVDDLVLSCGGTQIEKDKDVVWNDGSKFDTSTQDGGGWASGGGVSKLFAVPSIRSAPMFLSRLRPVGRGAVYQISR